MGKLLMPGSHPPEKKGLRLLNENEISSFHDLEKIDPERIPTPYSRAFDFARRLAGKEPDEASREQIIIIRQRKQEAVKTLEYLVKGIFYGIIDISDKLEWNELGLLGVVLQSSPGASELKHFGILRYKGQDIGSFYSETLGFYKAGFVDDDLRIEIDDFEKNESLSVKVFKKWILDEYERLKNNLPLWLKELYAQYNRDFSALTLITVEEYTYAMS